MCKKSLRDENEMGGISPKGSSRVSHSPMYSIHLLDNKEAYRQFTIKQVEDSQQASTPTGKVLLAVASQKALCEDTRLFQAARLSAHQDVINCLKDTLAWAITDLSNVKLTTHMRRSSCGDWDSAKDQSALGQKH